MLYDIIKSMYLMFVKCFSFLGSKKFSNNKVVFIVDFPQTDLTWIDELVNANLNVVVYYFTENLIGKEQLLKGGIKCYKVSNNISFVFKHIYNIASSSKIVIDNYLGFLASFNKHSKTEIIQIWHANGAIKKFGLSANQNLNRSKSAKKRFYKVYENIDTYVVASDEMQEIFYESYLAKNKNFLHFGYYAVDKYFDEEYISYSRLQFYKEFEELKDKKIILYAPTYREPGFNFLGIDIEKLSLSIPSEYHILVKYHPHMDIPDYSNLKNVTVIDNKTSKFDILPIVDCLITDYSSIIYDYSVLKKNKQLFIYAEDFEQYKHHVGVNNWFDKFYLDHRIETVEELCDNIKKNILFDETKFTSTWNKFNDGKTKERITQYIIKNY